MRRDQGSIRVVAVAEVGVGERRFDQRRRKRRALVILIARYVERNRMSNTVFRRSDVFVRVGIENLWQRFIVGLGKEVDAKGPAKLYLEVETRLACTCDCVVQARGVELILGILDLPSCPTWNTRRDKIRLVRAWHLCYRLFPI